MNKKRKKIGQKKVSRKARKTVLSRPKKRVQSKTKEKKPFEKEKRFREILLRKREEILSAIKRKEENFSLEEIGDEADVANQTFEREMMFKMTDGEQIVLENVEAALRKIEKGNFWFCESCHKKISLERLNAMPWTRYCVLCQKRIDLPSAI